MKLSERVAVITEENINRLSHLYGKMDLDDLSRIVNNHLKVAIDEIEEDYLKQKEHCCTECEYMKKYDYGKEIYCCDHVDRTDDMGKLSVNKLPEKSPEWCPFQRTTYTVTRNIDWTKPDAIATYTDYLHNITKEQIGLI